MRRAAIALAGLIALGLAGCPKDDDDTMTLGEANEALAEASVSTQAAELSSTAVEISTNFTIATALQAAAVELRNFIESQLPCADISVQDATLSITYGAKPGNCTYRGQDFSGTHTVKLSRNDLNAVEVNHTWTDLSNGRVKVSGTATVTWSFGDKTRHIVHELNWTRLADGRNGKGSGDRTQRVLPGGLEEGIQVEGARWWDGPKGHWDLAIQGVQIRLSDPVPQSGAYVLVNPDSKKLTLSFKRVDDDTIRVTISSGKRSFEFNVNKLTGQSE